ncbi:MAG TPA: methyltransferase domain-containing protein [Conexibacter sp.]
MEGSARDTWSPQVYGRFADERAAPAHDLLGMVEPVPGGTAVDLGCGPGTLTRELHRRVGAATTVGVDSSARMLERAEQLAREEPADDEADARRLAGAGEPRLAGAGAGEPGLAGAGAGEPRLAGAGAGEPGLRFVRATIEGWEPDAPLDVVFSNAALHWVADHALLFARLRGWLAPGGQLAVQIPDNLDAVTHRTADEVAREAPFAELLGPQPPRPPLLSSERYALLLHDLGFTRQRVERRVYLHLLDGPEGLIDWFRGSLLSEYERRLDPAVFEAFMTRYRSLLLERVEPRSPYPLAFPRILMWGRLPQ